MKAKWVQFAHPMEGTKVEGYWYRWGDVMACVDSHGGVMWHVSVSCKNRYPTWEEIKAAWYELVPGAEERTGAIQLPKKVEYVNLHGNCFHVYELTEAEMPKLVASE